MSDDAPLTRRTVLQAAGVTVGTAVLGSAAYATSRDTASEAPGFEWQQTFDSDGQTRVQGSTIAQGTEGGYGVSADFGGYEEAAVVQFDPEGTRTSTTDVTGDGHITAGPSGGFLLARRTKVNDEKIVLVKIDAAGSVVWDKKIDVPQSASIVMDAVRRPAGGYAIAVSAGANRRGAWLVLVEEDGTKVATEEYESRTDEYQQAKEEEGVTYSTFHSLTTTSEGGYAFAGRVNYGEGAEKDDEAWVLEVGEGLDMEWEQTFEGFANHIIELQDGRFAVVTGQADDVGYTTFTSDGEIDSTENYRPREGADGHGIVQRTSEELVLKCYTAGDDTNFLLGVSSDGEKRWTKQFDTGYRISQLIATSDGGLAVTGWKGTGEDSDGDGDEDTVGYVAKLGDGASQESPTDTATPTSTDSETPTPTPTTTASETETQTDEKDCEI